MHIKYITWGPLVDILFKIQNIQLTRSSNYRHIYIEVIVLRQINCQISTCMKNLFRTSFG